MVIPTAILLTSIFLFILVIPTILFVRALGYRRRRRDRKRNIPRCPCGYALIALTLPRCPECGRLVGFNQTAADLGISEESMRAHAAAKNARTEDSK